MTTSTSPVQRFGGFEIDPCSRELCRDGIRIRMQPQPLEVLLLLLARKGEVVTREELKRKLWPVGTFVDAEDGLNTAIRKLREFLGDSAECPVYIETIPRRGYRFICPIEESGSRPIATPQSIASSSFSETNWGETVPAEVPANGAKTFPVLQLLFAAAGLASAVWYLRRPLPPPRISAYTQITFDGYGKSLGGTDGSRLYFCLDGGGIRQVAVPGGASEPITIDVPNPGFEATALSPDGSSMLVGSFDLSDKDPISICSHTGRLGSLRDRRCYICNLVGRRGVGGLLDGGGRCKYCSERWD
jgi:DNA-binding winged helix-turn-helix (wHTH) protein